MSRRNSGLPNVLPKGAVETVSNMDLILAKLNHDSKAGQTNIDRIVIGHKK